MPVVCQCAWNFFACSNQIICIFLYVRQTYGISYTLCVCFGYGQRMTMDRADGPG